MMVRRGHTYAFCTGQKRRRPEKCLLHFSLLIRILAHPPPTPHPIHGEAPSDPRDSHTARKMRSSRGPNKCQQTLTEVPAVYESTRRLL